MTDDEFASSLRVNESDRTLVLAIRKVLADMCRVPVEEIDASTRVEECYRLMTETIMDGWDELDFWFRLEGELQRKIVSRPGELSSLLKRRQARLRAAGRTDRVAAWTRAVLPPIRRGLSITHERRRAIADRALRLRKLRRAKRRRVRLTREQFSQQAIAAGMPALRGD